jgi:hypothetical protein
MSNNNIYICFKEYGLPYLTQTPVGSGCIQSTIDNNAFQSVYIYYRNIYLENLANLKKQYEEQIFRIKVKNYGRYHDIAAYGNPNVSKRLIGPLCTAIYKFRKTF